MPLRSRPATATNAGKKLVITSIAVAAAILAVGILIGWLALGR
jgi:hypothetical protein